MFTKRLWELLLLLSCTVAQGSLWEYDDQQQNAVFGKNVHGNYGPKTGRYAPLRGSWLPI